MRIELAASSRIKRANKAGSTSQTQTHIWISQIKSISAEVDDKSQWIVHVGVAIETRLCPEHRYFLEPAAATNHRRRRRNLFIDSEAINQERTLQESACQMEVAPHTHSEAEQRPSFPNAQEASSLQRLREEPKSKRTNIATNLHSGGQLLSATMTTPNWSARSRRKRSCSPLVIATLSLSLLAVTFAAADHQRQAGKASGQQQQQRIEQQQATGEYAS